MFGHDGQFHAHGSDLLWDCRRCGTAGGMKHYDDAASATRYATAVEAERENQGKRFMLSATPLRLWRKLRRRR